MSTYVRLMKLHDGILSMIACLLNVLITSFAIYCIFFLIAHTVFVLYHFNLIQTNNFYSSLFKKNFLFIQVEIDRMGHEHVCVSLL